MARFQKSNIPTVEEIENLAVEAVGNPEKLQELGKLAEKLGRRANQNLRQLEKAGYESDAYKYAKSKLGTDKPRYSQAHTGSAAALAESAIQSATFLRLKTATVGGVREKARPGFQKLVEKAVKDLKQKDKYKKKDEKKLERDMTKFLNSKAFEELKSLGSDIIDATFEALERGANIDELLESYEKYSNGDLDEGEGLLTVWDNWVKK